MTILSPLTGTANVVLEKRIPSGFIIENYDRQLHIDVSEYFEGLQTIEICRCLDTGFRFYYPFTLVGRDRLYQELQKYEWYYEDWKWEYELARGLINQNDCVLEIGCGPGNFIDNLQRDGVECAGLELNVSATEIGRSKGLKVFNQTIQDHAKEYFGGYDVVCMFQVMEHVVSVKEFIQACVDALRPGGLLIVSVPNNDSVMFRLNDDLVLNMPPHHMGLWNANSLASLQTFGIRLTRMEFESLEKHRRFVEQPLQARLATRLTEKYGLLGRLATSSAKRVVPWTLSAVMKDIPGHTLLVVFTKP